MLEGSSRSTLNETPRVLRLSKLVHSVDPRELAWNMTTPDAGAKEDMA